MHGFANDKSRSHGVAGEYDTFTLRVEYPNVIDMYVINSCLKLL